MLGMRDISTTNLRQGASAYLNALTAGETMRLVRNGQTVGYLVSPRDWNELNGVTVRELSELCHVSMGTVSQRVSLLVNDAHWGPHRTVARAEGLATPDVVLTPDAAQEIANQISLLPKD